MTTPSSITTASASFRIAYLDQHLSTPFLNVPAQHRLALLRCPHAMRCQPRHAVAPPPASIQALTLSAALRFLEPKGLD